MKLNALEGIEHVANKFRIDNNLSLTEAINLKSLLRKLNILTIYKPLSDTFNGMSLQTSKGAKFILINSNKPKGRQHFTIAHELYHLYFDIDPIPHICSEENGGKTQIEKNADSFASALLMPYEGLINCIPKEELSSNISLATIIKTEQYFSVSRTALLYRLKKKSIISKNEFESFSTVSPQESAKQFGYDISLYKKGNENLVIGDYGVLARKLYDLGKISEGHYRELLNKIQKDE